MHAGEEEQRNNVGLRDAINVIAALRNRLDEMHVREALARHLNGPRMAINGLCSGLEPWLLVVITFAVSLIIFKIGSFLRKDESLSERGKKFGFRILKNLPVVKGYIGKKMEKTRIEIMDKVLEVNEGMPFVLRLPETGWTKERIFEETDKYERLGSCDWEKGRASGAVYNYDADLVDIATRVYGRCAWTNPLHHDVFPGVHKMEAEVVRMVCSMFHGDANTCGVMTSGGTESILMACKAYRDRALSLGVARPQIVAPVTAHAAFDKAAALMKMEIVHVPVDGRTMKVDVKAMSKAITSDTCLLVVSAPHFPHGIIDPIEEVAQLGLRRNIPVHVDSCLGGFLLPFMDKAGFPIPAFDFRVKGVTSISCDTHKYGAAPKGTSVLVYRDKSLRHFQFFVQPDWPGGIYASPSIPGSRSGGVIATCWATMLHIGEEGYVEMTRRIIDTAKRIKAGLTAVEHLYVLGNPEVSVIAFGSHDFNIYRLSDDLSHLGWNLNALQFPSCIHLCVTNMHTKAGVADEFLHDIRSCVEIIMRDPKANKGGMAAMYGLAQSIPDRSMVSQMAYYFLDACYSTENQKSKDDSTTETEKKLN